MKVTIDEYKKSIKKSIDSMSREDKITYARQTTGSNGSLLTYLSMTEEDLEQVVIDGMVQNAIFEGMIK